APAARGARAARGTRCHARRGAPNGREQARRPDRACAVQGSACVPRSGRRRRRQHLGDAAGGGPRASRRRLERRAALLDAGPAPRRRSLVGRRAAQEGRSLPCGARRRAAVAPRRRARGGRPAVRGWTAALGSAARGWGGRVIAGGTTAVRALETAAAPDGTVEPGEGWTSHIVCAECKVRAVDGLITGWHEPEASHLQMLQAIADEELLAKCYRAALEHGYLWHEFGDSHLILP